MSCILSCATYFYVCTSFIFRVLLIRINEFAVIRRAPCEINRNGTNNAVESLKTFEWSNINLCLLKMQKSKTHYSYSLCNACQLFNFPWYNLSHLSKCISGWPFSFPSFSFHLLMSNPQWYFSLWSTPTITFYQSIILYIHISFPNEIKIM